MHEGKINVYSFEMNGKKHSLHPLKDKQEEANNQLLIMTDKKIMNDWKAEANDNEVELTNMVCSGWLKGKTYQQEMSNASMALIEEAQCEVNKNNGKCMVTEITKDGDVTITRKGEEGKIIQEENSWTSSIIMVINFMFTIVTGRLNCLYAGRGEQLTTCLQGK